MSSFRNAGLIWNQAGSQVIHGNVIFSGEHGATIKRSRLENASSQMLLDDDILASLAFPQMSERRRNIDPAHHRTCQWIFNLSQYQQWRGAPRGLLWIKGKPGSGKSTLMSHLYSDLCNQPDRSEVKLEFFFNARGTLLQHTSTGMLRALLSQIFYQDHSIRDVLRRRFRDRCVPSGGGEPNGDWQLPELKTAFQEVISTSAQSKQITICVDALDEAGEQAARDIARYFHAINDFVEVQRGSARICISCRHYPILSTTRAIEIYVDQHNHQDIETFVKDYLCLQNLSHEPVNHQQVWLAMAEHLIMMARGVFQWVVLVVPMVAKWMGDGSTPREIHQKLEMVPQELEEVYRHILKRIVDHGHRARCLRLFQWVILAQEPLSVATVQRAMAAFELEITGSVTPSGGMTGAFEAQEDMRPRIRSWSGGLIEVVISDEVDPWNDERTINFVQVIHQSVNDFLMQDGLCFLMALNDPYSAPKSVEGPRVSISEAIAISHGALYWSCLNMFCLNAVQEVLNTSSGLLDSFLRYATAHCFIHATLAGQHRGQDHESESHLLTQAFPALRFCVGSNPSNTKFYPLFGTTILHMAAGAGLEDLVRYRLTSNDDINAKNQYGWTALHLAAERDDLPIVDMLFDAGSRIQDVTDAGDSPLFIAAARGCVRVFTRLVAMGANVHSTGKNSKGVLYVAACASCYSICKLCIDCGVDVNAHGGRDGTALQAAAWRGGSRVVNLLLKAGADVNSLGGFYGSALIAAVWHRQEEIVRLLLKAGADVNLPGGCYGTALQTAARGGDKEMMQMLLDAGADVNIQSGLHQSALHAAAYYASDYRLDRTYYSGGDLIRLLLDAGADPNTHGGSEGSALQAAAINSGNMDATQLIISAGANVNFQGGPFHTALQAAILHRGHTGVVELLFNAGADVKIQGGPHGNALQTAAYKGRKSIVRRLLEAGADVNAQGGQHSNAFQAGVLSRQALDVTRLLLKAGANVNAHGGPYGNALQAASFRGYGQVVNLLLEYGASVDAPGGRYGSALGAALARAHNHIVDILRSAGAKLPDRSSHSNDQAESGQIK